MKKLVITKLAILLLVNIMFVSCNFSTKLRETDIIINPNPVPEQIVIGDEVIYGDQFSLKDVYDEIFNEIEDTTRKISISRNIEPEDIFEFNDNDFIDMIYFSVHPTTIDSLKLINNTLGYLNPTELDKEILQACDAEKIIFTGQAITNYNNIENTINFDTKYYYIVAEDSANIFSSILEGYQEIEKFEVITQDALDRISEIFMEFEDLENMNEARGALNKLWKKIKKAAETVADTISSATDSIVQFLTKKYTISGKVFFTYGGITKTAYGIQITANGNSELKIQTDTTGKFSFKELPDSAGLQTIWINYNNQACKLSNFFDLTAATLVKTGFPSQLQDLTIKSNSDYANAKMAICSDLLNRYKDESKRHLNIPQAKIWTSEIGSGTSSAPAFFLRGQSEFPDIVLTGVSSEDNQFEKLKILHHEYTHFLHCCFVKNSSNSNFWQEIVKSEIGSSITNKTGNSEAIMNFINRLLNTNTICGNFYDYNNPYVYFTENYAEWYSYVGCYGKGYVLQQKDSIYEKGSYFKKDDYYFPNTKIFTVITSIFENSNITNSADEIVSIIDKYDVTTFDELYSALIKEYPLLKTKINDAFKEYKQYGTTKGNIIIYQ